MNREQKRAQHAYARVEEVVENRNFSKEYRTLVMGLGANIMRSGLTATISFIQRYRKKEAASCLLADLAQFSFPHIPLDANLETSELGKQFANRVRALDSEEYMLVTREVLKLSIWMRRAVQALIHTDGDEG